MKKYILLFVYYAMLSSNHAQTRFEKYSDPSSAINTSSAHGTYTGSSWVDYDRDGLLDLFVVRNGLYHNDGQGKFSRNTTSGISFAGGLGTTWADYDNDGWIDCFITGGGQFGSRLYKNQGNGTFTQNVQGLLNVPTGLRGWGAAFGNMNNDHFTDLFIAAPFGFVGITDASKALINNRDGSFSKIIINPVTDSLDAYTIPTWSDYDNDGDQDLFIGTGRVNGELFEDYAFQNNSRPGDSNPSFSRLSGQKIWQEGRDGQVWNWIDYDNDGDLDVFITNYTGLDVNNGWPNELYENRQGEMQRLTAEEVGPIASDTTTSLGSVWADFDNDGDLDCMVTNDGEPAAYYESNIMQGSKRFSKKTNGLPFTQRAANTYCASAGDYDKDGDLDLFITSPHPIIRGLYQNKLVNTGSANWAAFKLEGVQSNVSAIGAKVKILAMINGRKIWQMREVSAQNTFNGMNMLDSHFGLGDAKRIEKIIVEWPSGQKTECEHLVANRFYNFSEGNPCPTDVDLELTISVNDSTLLKGDVVMTTLTVVNKGSVKATGVKVMFKPPYISLPNGFGYLSHLSSKGNYTQNKGIWYIDQLDLDETQTMQIKLLTFQDAISAILSAQVYACDQVDYDSEPNNMSLKVKEDDESSITLTHTNSEFNTALEQRSLLSSVYPNPAHNYLQVQFPFHSSSWNMALIDVSGKIVESVNQIKNGNLVLHTGHLANGMYLIKCSDHQRTYTHKIVINH